MNRAIIFAAAAFAVAPISSARAQGDIQVSGLLSTVLRNAHEQDFTNLTFRQFSNYNTLRTRLFFDGQVNDRTYAFAQILEEEYTFQLYSAYVRIERLAGPRLNVQAGLIPTPVGAYAPRTYSDKNPLIGTPLLYNYHSNYVLQRSDSVTTVDALLATRDTRTNVGLPVIYDACWNSGVEWFGSFGKLDWSLGAITGSLGRPTMQQEDKAPQVTGRLVYNYRPGLVVGASGFYGPYLYPGAYHDSLPAGAHLNDYRNAGAGYQLYVAHRQFEFHSEAFYCYWDDPYLDKLEVVSGYAEAKCTIAAGWYVAGRFGWFEPSDLTDSTGAQEPWDYPVKRYEFGGGYIPYRHLILKAVAQLNRFEGAPALDHDLYALQMVASF